MIHFDTLLRRQSYLWYEYTQGCIVLKNDFRGKHRKQRWLLRFFLRHKLKEMGFGGSKIPSVTTFHKTGANKNRCNFKSVTSLTPLRLSGRRFRGHLVDGKDLPLYVRDHLTQDPRAHLTHPFFFGQYTPIIYCPPYYNRYWKNVWLCSICEMRIYAGIMSYEWIIFKKKTKSSSS